MTEYRIDISRVNSRDDLHDALEEALPLPSWYGRNLDALYDVLTSLPESFEESEDGELLIPSSDEPDPEGSNSGSAKTDAPDDGGFRFVFRGTAQALAGETGEYVQRMRRMCERIENNEDNISFCWE